MEQDTPQQSDQGKMHVPSKLRSKASAGSTNRICPKKTTTLPNETVEYLKAWMMSPEHVAHPYPTESEKAKIMEDTGLELKQLTNWFVNNRKRYWKPRVEAHLLKDQEINLESPHSQGQLDTGDKSNPSTKLEKSRIVVEIVGDVPSSLRASKRKGQTEEFNFTDEMATPNSRANSSIAHLISGHNSSASQSDGTTSCSDSDDERLIYKGSASMQLFQTSVSEKIDVHILRPELSSATLPGLMDVTVVPNVAPERILKTFHACPLTYSSFSKKKSIKSRNSGHRLDSEILRLKKHCLSLFLAEHENHSSVGTDNEADNSLSTPCAPKDQIIAKRKHELHVIPDGITEDGITEDHLGTIASIMYSPRPKYRRRSIDIWKEACQTASNVYDDDELPSLEEATRLFGYAK